MTERQDEERKPFSQEEDGILYEPDEELGDVVALKEKTKKLRTELDESKKEAKEYLDGWQRCKADAVNARKEMEARAKRNAELLREELVYDIIPALDSFDMAARSESWSKIDSGWKSGMEQVRDQLVAALRRHGIERFGAVGDVYEPALHDVAEEKEDISGEVGSVVKILRFGYKTVDKVLRPAHVIIKSSEK